MISYFRIDINCAECFTNVVEAVASAPSVDHVDADIAQGCLTVSHTGDEAVIAHLIVGVGRRFEVADNGEIIEGDAHATLAAAVSGVSHLSHPPARTLRDGGAPGIGTERV